MVVLYIIVCLLIIYLNNPTYNFYKIYSNIILYLWIFQNRNNTIELKKILKNMNKIGIAPYINNNTKIYIPGKYNIMIKCTIIKFMEKKIHYLYF